MGFVWRNNDLNDLKTTLGGRGAGGKQILRVVLDDIADEAEDRMKAWIENIPSGLVPGKIGRVDTGHMRDMVGREEVKETAHSVSVRFGWVTQVEDYFLYQENGAEPGRKSIPPMHALLGTFLWAREEARQRIEGLQ